MLAIASDTSEVDFKKSRKYSRNQKIKILVDALRIVAKDKDLSLEKIYIPDECEQYGFSEGHHQFGVIFQFLADMIEE